MRHHFHNTGASRSFSVNQYVLPPLLEHLPVAGAMEARADMAARRNNGECRQKAAEMPFCHAMCESRRRYRRRPPRRISRACSPESRKMPSFSGMSRHAIAGAHLTSDDITASMQAGVMSGSQWRKAASKSYYKSLAISRLPAQLRQDRGK